MFIGPDCDTELHTSADEQLRMLSHTCCRFDGGVADTSDGVVRTGGVRVAGGEAGVPWEPHV